MRTITRRRHHSEAQSNGSKIRRMLENESGSEVLYRTITAGPSGQRSDLAIAWAAYTERNNMEMRISMAGGPFRGEAAGWARRSFMEVSREEIPTGIVLGERERTRTVICGRQMWAIYSDDHNGGMEWLGYAETLSLGCDVLINGHYGAAGNHDSARISSGKWVPREAFIR